MLAVPTMAGACGLGQTQVPGWTGRRGPPGPVVKQHAARFKERKHRGAEPAVRPERVHRLQPRRGIRRSAAEAGFSKFDEGRAALRSLGAALVRRRWNWRTSRFG